MSETPEPSRGIAFAALGAGFFLLALTEFELHFLHKYHAMAIAVIPICLVVGVAGLVEPKLINPSHPSYAETPGMGKHKVVSAVLKGVSGCLGIYLAAAMMFDLWLPQFLIDHLAQ